MDKDSTFSWTLHCSRVMQKWECHLWIAEVLCNAGKGKLWGPHWALTCEGIGKTLGYIPIWAETWQKWESGLKGCPRDSVLGTGNNRGKVPRWACIWVGRKIQRWKQQTVLLPSWNVELHGLGRQLGANLPNRCVNHKGLLFQEKYTDGAWRSCEDTWSNLREGFLQGMWFKPKSKEQGNFNWVEGPRLRHIKEGISWTRNRVCSKGTGPVQRNLRSRGLPCRAWRGKHPE